MLSQNIFYLFLPSPVNVIKIFHLELKFIIVVVYEKNCRAFLHTLSVCVSISIPLNLLYPNRLFTRFSIFELLRQSMYNRTRSQDTFQLPFLISSNKGKARRGVADGGPDDDGDYATLRELPLINSMDPADDTTSEENKVSSNPTM